MPSPSTEAPSTEAPSTEAPRRLVIMTTDLAVLEALRPRLPAGWEMAATVDFETLDEGDAPWNRFVVLDLDEFDAFDPIGVIHDLYTRCHAGVLVFGFGGDEDIREQVRRAGTAVFLERDDLAGKLPQLLQQLDRPEIAD